MGSVRASYGLFTAVSPEPRAVPGKCKWNEGEKTAPSLDANVLESQIWTQHPAPTRVALPCWDAHSAELMGAPEARRECCPAPGHMQHCTTGSHCFAELTDDTKRGFTVLCEATVTLQQRLGQAVYNVSHSFSFKITISSPSAQVMG